MIFSFISEGVEASALNAYGGRPENGRRSLRGLINWMNKESWEDKDESVGEIQVSERKIANLSSSE